MANSMRSVMKHSFAEVPRAEIPRSSFDRSHGVKTTFQAGRLIPFFVDEALPGDTFNLRTSGFARLSTPIYPIMDNMRMDTFYFAVPIRLLWANFQKMMGEQENPGDSTDFLVPTVNAPGDNGYGEGTIADYFGIPTKEPEVVVSALYSRAYTLIYNEWFRDQNLQDSKPFSTDDGPDQSSRLSAAPWRRGKRHDYFTSSLPWPQKGPGVEVPIGDTAPVVHNNTSPNFIGAVDGETYSFWLDNSAGNVETFPPYDGNPNGGIQRWANTGMRADLSDATGITINQLRQAFQIQKMYERDARGGSRYTEIIKSHFGVTSPDARLQRPEYLGGGSTPVHIQPTASTAETDPSGQPEGRNLGDLAGIGTASFTGHGFSKSFTEHCVVIGIVNVRADLTYQQGLNRMFSRRDRLDFFWPALSHLGEQEVLNKEIYFQGNAADDEVFGYQERFAEYRYKPSTIHGAFRSNSDEPLDAWHLSQEFGSLPTLGEEFIEETPPMSRILAVPSEPHFIGDFHHRLITARPMPLYGVPGNIDRF